jgi:hypothetical protein
VSVTEDEADLKAAGFDVPAERAKAGAFLDALGSGVSTSSSEEAPPRVSEALRRKGPRLAVLWLAAAACDAKQWGVCLAELDEARAVDPGGDDASSVKSLRDNAIAGILEPH